jgi:prophage maintenance system killer protein
MDVEGRVPWREVEPLPNTNGTLEPLLKTVTTLHDAWEDALLSASVEEVVAARERRLRRHAIETGIIERLYELDWGVTEALVAEGLSSEVASQYGGINDDVLRIIRSQYDALDYVTSLVAGDGGLSVTTIRRLHHLITRHPDTYEATDMFGTTVKAPLHHGEWKSHPNHVRRPDGSLLEYTPPEQVQSQIDRLIEMFGHTEGAHPVVRAAWLHHRFICIHPFEDGNGRVARALTLLVLLQAHYAPLVVDRRERRSYIAALDAANEGDLGDLIRFFARLEIASLQSTLTEPPRVLARDAASAMRAAVVRLRERDAATIAEKVKTVRELAAKTHGMIGGYLEGQRRELEASLHDVDSLSRAAIFSATPPEERALWWRRQLIKAAQAADFYTNLADGTWWVQLRLDALGDRLRYLAAVQKVGHGETGFLAVTVYAELAHPESDEAQPVAEPVLQLGPIDSVALAYSDDLAERWPEVEDLLRRTLLDATEYFIAGLG